MGAALLLSPNSPVPAHSFGRIRMQGLGEPGQRVDVTVLGSMAQRAVGLAWALDWAEHRESGTASGTSTFFFRTGLTRGVPRTIVSQMPYQPLALALCIHIARLGSLSAPSAVIRAQSFDPLCTQILLTAIMPTLLPLFSRQDWCAHGSGKSLMGRLDTRALAIELVRWSRGCDQC